MSYAVNPDLRIAASTALLQRGCVNVIRLDTIKTEAGTRWSKIRDAVCAQMESLLRQRLAPSDFFVSLDDVTFLVSSPSADTDVSQVLCLRVAHELHINFLGACAIGSLRIARAVGLNGDVLEVAEIAGTELLRLGARAGISCMDLDSKAARNGGDSCPSRSAGSFRENFIPIWDAQREAVTAHRCVTLTTPSVHQRDGNASQARTELAATLSRIEHAARSLSKNLKEGNRFLVFVPITYDTLSSPIGRMEIVSTCRNLASNLRSYLVFEISDLPYGVPQSRLFELVGILRPFCRAVAGQLPARISSYGTYQSAGLQLIGLSLTANGAAATEMDSEVFKLCTAAKRLQVTSFVWDALTKGAVMRAREQGANFISGPPVGDPTEEPAPIKRLSLADVSCVSSTVNWPV